MTYGFKRAGNFLSVMLICIASLSSAMAQTISFTPSTLIGDNLSQPTSLQFGPDGRLYVAEQFGRILVYSVTRNSANSYQITDTEEILLIKQIPNHDDNGVLNAAVNTRQVTGIVVAGTAATPVIYVTSSDPRIGGGSGANNDKNLDTNSGIISRLTWNGSAWVKLDLVRGLPRSEENHSPNGLAYDKVNNVLYMAQGGNTNMGAPSNNFAYLPEYAYSTAILKIDLNAIGNSTYDLPTLDDETRTNVSGNDVNDPFGGNDGLNQGKLVAGSPVSIYSPGWRNNYDVLLTSTNKMYSFDNGPNGGWGGPPTACSIAASEPGTTYCDGLHYVNAQGYYAGFPNPVRANRSITFNTSNPQTPIPLGMENAAECTYIVPGSNGSLTTICSSTNGMAEYTSSNFSNSMKGNLLAVAFNGKLYRFKMNASGNAIAPGGQTILASGIGSIPLDVVAQGDNEIFPGTMWVAMYGSNDIVIFEPNDFASCAGDANSLTLDDDGDGYSNGDETQNATDKCSPASVPSDFDHDFVSDLIDTDDDNDGILDNTDKFAQDANNGTTTTIPVLFAYQNTNNGGIGGWGYTGVMTNNVDDYMNLYDMDNMTVGGAAYKFTVDNIPSGDALGNLNTQKYAYQLGVNVGSFPFGYVVNGRVMGPFAGLTPTNFRSMGVFMGTGDQDNYLKMVCAANGGAGGIEIVKEVGGVVTSTMHSVAILGSSHVNLYLQVDPTTQMVQPSYSLGGGTRTNLGPQISVPAAWLSNVLAVGFISTSRGATPFSATWDYIAVEPVEGVGNWVNINTGNTCTARHESAFVECGTKFYLLGGRGTKPVEAYNYNSKTWATAAAPPLQLHHFQAVPLNGLIYVVGAFTGNFPNETPVPSIYIYDPVANVWHVGMDIPALRRRGSAGVVVYNEKIYMVSGLTNGHVSGWVPYMDVFDPRTNTWTELPDAPHARDHFQVALHGDKIYAIGGRLSGFGGNTFATTVPETDVYDISEQTWITLASPEGDIPTQRAACALAVMGDEILAIGGESMSQNSAHAHTEALDVNTNSWRTLDDLNTGRHGTQAIVNNYGIYIAAGCGNRGGTPELNTVEAFYLFGQTTPTGTAVTKGALTIAPGNLSFGNVHLGNSNTQTLYITNPGGNQALMIKTLSMSAGVNYSFVSPLAMPIALNAGDTLAVNITFSPASTGTKNGTFTIAHSGTNAVNTIINMTGVGVGQQTSVRINAGGPGYTTAATENFIADTYYSNFAGSKSTTTQAIAGTTEDALYQTERYGNAFGYAVPLQNGSYTVKLHFAEIWTGASNPGVRVFDASIEGALVIDDLDIYSVVGMYNAHVRTFNVTVSDGTMNIDFLASVNNAKVNAIEIIAPIATQGVLTAVPSNMVFPQTDVNVISTPRTMSLTNTGGASLTINSVSISGTNASNYLHNFGSAVTLAVGATHTFTVTFTPSASGTRIATMSINHTGSNSPLSVSLSGTGSSTVADCGYFVEQNGLLVMEIENAPATLGWTSETAYANYTGTEYYTWTGPNYFREKGHGMMTYEFKINNPGKYRFKMRTRNGGPLNTHNNDVWVRFPDHGCTFEKNGQVQSSASGWWKQWQNNLGGWTYNSWAGESAFWEVYVTFPFAGVYTMDISGRAQLYSLDRIVFYRMDMMGDYAATSANPPQSPWENCPTTPLVWYKDADRDYYGSPTDSVISVSKPGVGYVWNKLDCDDGRGTVYPGAPELLDGRDNDCDGVVDEGAYLTALSINCGGSYHNAVNGNVFESDRLYSLPSSAKYYSGIGDILNTDDEPLFRSERITSTSNNLKYNFKAQPGLYSVTFLWTEQNTVMNAGERVFDVYVEDSLVINDLDIIAVAGYKTAYSFTHNFRLMDTTLNIKVVDVVGKAKINALKVAQKPNTPPTFTINGSSTFNEDFVGTNYMNVAPAVVPPHEAYQVVTYSLTPASVPFANVSINPSTGQVSITAVPNAIGQQQFTITANDGYATNNIATKTFTLKLNAVNDAPVFTLSGNVTVNEDFAGTQTVTATPVTVPADETVQTVTYSISPASVSFATVSINSLTGQVSISSIAEMSGTQIFTVTANDGQAANNTATQTFTLTVNPVNDAPTLNAISDITIDEGAGTQTVNLSGISAGPNETQTLSVSAVSDNPSLIANPAVNYTSANATGSLSFAPLANQFGVAHISVTVSDGSLSFDRMFTVIVNAVNSAPVFTMSGNVSVNEDFATAQHVTAIPGFVPADEMSQVVTYSLSPASVSFANVSINSATGEVTITAVANASGSQIFTVTADDGEVTNNIATATFTLTVTSVNDAPAFTLSGDVTVNEDFATAQHVTVSAGSIPSNETSQTVTYSLSPASVAFANVSINSATGEVTITAIANAVGSQVFTVTANDGQAANNTATQTFTLTVNNVNDAPVFTLSGNVTVSEDFATAQHVTVTAGSIPANESSQSVTYSISPASVSFANISINSATGEVTITSIANASGSQLFIVTANDGQSTNNTHAQTFTLTVNSVNDAPVFTLSGNVTVNEDFATAQHVTVSASSVPADEMSQVVTYSLSPASVSFSNVSINSATGKVTITAVANASGSQLFTVTANDGQSTNNTHAQTFTLTINSVNDAPAFTLSGDVMVVEGMYTSETVSVAPAAVPANEVSQTVTYSLLPASVSFANVSINSATGAVTITPVANQFGTQVFTVTANDGQSQNNTYTQTFTLTVDEGNNPPSFATSGDVTVNEDFAIAQVVTVTPDAVRPHEAGQVVTYSLLPASVAFANISFDSNSGEVTITAIANQQGSQQFTISADDAQSRNNIHTETFMLTVNSVNDAPVFTLSGDVTENENFTTTETVTVSAGFVPANEMSQTVTYSISPASISFATVSMNSTTGKVTITSVQDEFGIQVFTVTANDGQAINNTTSQTFTLTVSEGNNTPVFTTSSDVIVNEDFSTSEVVTVTPGSIRPVDAGQVVTYTLSPSSVSFATVSINSATGAVTINSIAHANGSQAFTITADDGQSVNNIHTETFLLTVNSVNDAPVFTLSGDVTENENFTTTETVIVSAGFVPANEMSQTVTYSLSPVSVSFADVSINSATGDVTITAVADEFGTQVFTVTANDGQAANNRHTQTFTLTVNEGNNTPAFTTSGDVVVSEDFATSEVVIVTPGAIRPVDAGQTVTYSLTPASVAFSTVSINSATGAVTINAVANTNGSQAFTITADDEQSVNNIHEETFTLTVTAVNDAPAFTLSGDVTVDEDFATTEVVTVTPGIVPADEASQTVTYILSPASVSFATISFNSSTGKVTITSVANVSGTQVFTVTANDGQAQHNTASQTFTLTVNTANDQPTLDAIANPTAVLEDSGLKNMNLTGISAGGNENQTLTVSVTSDNPGLFSTLTVNYTSPNSTAVLSYQPAPNQWGSATVSVTVNDGQAANNTFIRTFIITVTSVNDAPKFVMNPTSLMLAEDFAGTQTVSVAPSVVPADEASQTITYSLSPMTVPFATVVFNNTTGEIQITAIANMNGSRTFTIMANDGQSQNSFHSETFVLTVTPVNDAPVFTVDNGVTVFKNFSSTETISVTPAPVPSDETFQTVTYVLNPTTVSFANVTFSSTTGTVQITSIANMTGSQTFTITADDAQAANNTHAEQFFFAVVDTNYQPTLDAIANPAAIDEDAAIQTIGLTGISAGFNEMQTVTVTAVSNNPALIPNPTVNYVNPAGTGSLDYKPASNQSGSAVITVTVDDGMSVNNTITRTFTVVVNPVNDEPTLDAISNPAAILEDAAMQTISITGSTAGLNEIQMLAVTATSDNPSLIASVVVNYNSPDNAGTLNYTPVANAFGTAVITVTINDGAANNNVITHTFTVVVTPVNDAPVITDVYKQGQEDKSIGFIADNFTDEYTDVENDAMTKIKIVSLPVNGTLLLNLIAVNSGDEISVSDIADLIYDPADEFAGVDSFLWNGFDGQLYAMNAAKVYLNVNNVNDKPYIVTHINDITVNEDAAAIQDYVNLENIFNDTENGGNMTYTVSMHSNPSLVNVSIDVDHKLDITFNANANGVATVAIQAMDAAGATVADTFSITVNSVEDIPSVFNLLTPTNGSIVSTPSAIEFTWETSEDGDGDAVEYAVNIKGHGLDTTMSGVSVTSLFFNGESAFTMDSTYKWKVIATDGDDAQTSATYSFKISITGINSPGLLENAPAAFPNPFSTQVVIHYNLKADATVVVKIHNFLGQQVATLVSEKQAKGEHYVKWSGADIAAGVYFYELTLVNRSGIESSFTGKLIKE